MRRGWEGWKGLRWHFLDSVSTYIYWKLTMCPPGHDSGPTMSINSFDLQHLRSGAGIWLRHTSGDVSVVVSTSDGSVLLPKAAWSESGKARCKSWSSGSHIHESNHSALLQFQPLEKQTAAKKSSSLGTENPAPLELALFPYFTEEQSKGFK